MARIKNRLFLLFLASYVVVALLPMIVMVGLYYTDETYSINNSLYQEMQGDTTYALSVLDSYLTIVTSIPRQLYDDPEILAYKTTGDTITRGKIIDKLGQIIGSNDMIEDIYLYFRKSKTLISAWSNSYDASSLRLYGKANALYYENLSYDELFDMLDSQYRAIVLPSQPAKAVSSSTFPVISFVDTLPQNNKHAYATVLTLVDARRVAQIVSGETTAGFLLFDPSGRMIAGRMNGEDASEDLIRQAGSSGQEPRRLTFDGKSYLMTTSVSAGTGWVLTQFHSVSRLTEMLKSLQFRILMIVTFLSASMIVLIYWVMRRTYKPVDNLYAVATRTVNPSSPEKHSRINPFETIENTIQTLHQNNVGLQNQLDHQTNYMAERTLRRLLNKPQSEWEPRHFEEGRRNGLDTDRETYQVLILYIPEEENIQSVTEQMRICSGSEYVASLTDETNSQVILILGGKKEEKSLFDRVDLSPLGAEIIAVGKTVSSADRWNESLNEAIRVANHALLHNDGSCVFRTEDLPKEVFSYDESHWIAIHNLLMVNYRSDIRMIRNSCDTVCDFLLSDSTNYVEAKMVTCQILSGFQDLIPEAGTELEQSVLRIYMDKTGINASVLVQEIRKYVDILCSHIESLRVDEGNPLLDRSIQFIHDNLTSRDLSLSVVAEYVGLSSSRYSTLFSQYVSCNYKTYVDNLRIEKAKKLLEDDSMMIQEIAEAVGYDSAYSFSRLFKKKVGMSPNDYRLSVHKI